MGIRQVQHSRVVPSIDQERSHGGVVPYPVAVREAEAPPVVPALFQVAEPQDVIEGVDRSPGTGRG